MRSDRMAVTVGAESLWIATRNRVHLAAWRQIGHVRPTVRRYGSNIRTEVRHAGVVEQQ